MSNSMKDLTTDTIGYHASQDWQIVKAAGATKQDTEFTYTFENFFHPYVGKLLKQLNVESLPGVFDAAWQKDLTKDFFDDYYKTLPTDVVVFGDAPKKEIDVTLDGPYANYNWELLFHIPVAVAVHLSKNQRFEEARRWFHFVFDPTSKDTTVDPPLRYWRFLGFRSDATVKNIAELLELLGKDNPTPAELDDINTVLAGLDAIRTQPFQPHAVARTRIASYQYYVFMKYLDNLIDWGDSLFVQDTIETINEATMCYVLASNLLGPRPDKLTNPGTVRAKTFAQLRAQGLDPMGNALVDLESAFPFNLSTPPTGSSEDDLSGALFGIGRTLYFSIPPNDKLLGYWDIVGDRLYKIRNCMNIEGVVRPLALFDPPLDPAMLVKAAAAGIDIGSIASGSDQPIGPVRALLLIQKASELASELKSLGASLLTALEKSDNERLALLRQTHEIRIHRLTEETRFLQWKHAQATTDGLLASRAVAYEKYAYYQRLLGSKPDHDTAPEKLKLDRRELTQDNFDEIHASLVDTYDKTIKDIPFPKLRLAGESSPSSQSGASGTGNLYLSKTEDSELNHLLPAAEDFHTTAFGLKQAAPMAALIPDFPVDLHYWGLGGTIVFGGTGLHKNMVTAAEVLEMIAARYTADAGRASKTASYERRADEWIQQNNLAARELMQMGKQIIASLIAEQAAKNEYQTARKQLAQAEEMREKTESKFTNQKLYAWMQGELSRLFYQYYRFAFDVARRAERTMKRELMRPELDETDFVQFNYWDGGRKGLLSGETLHFDVKRMEMAYHDNNKRELELTRHVSLRQLDPIALMTLKVTGKCTVTIPEWLYDRDCPGHYMRRIKTVGLSMPSVVGPYTSVSCKLTLLRSSVRTSSLLLDNTYSRKDEPNTDTRFVDYVGSVQSIVTSTGNNDTGMFETNLRDERMLPFEGMGAISTWQLELPTKLQGFDYSTISDVIIHVRYTARDGGELLGSASTSEIATDLQDPAKSELALLFAPRYDFSSEWAAFQNTGTLTFSLRKDYFPYMVQGSSTLAVHGIDLYAPGNNKLVKQAVALPGTVNQDLTGPNRAATITIPKGGVLQSAATGIALVVRYSM